MVFMRQVHTYCTVYKDSKLYLNCAHQSIFFTQQLIQFVVISNIESPKETC